MEKKKPIGMNETPERVVPGTSSWDLYGAEHLQRYEFFKHLYSNNIVIDAACGSGYGTHLIRQYDARQAIGIDISEEAVSYAKTHYSAEGLSYRVLECENISALQTEADVVVSFETIEHLKEPERFIREVSTVLKKDGVFICSTPNKQRLSGEGNINPFHHSELEWDEFRRIFEKYFRVESCYHQTETIEYLRYQEVRHLLHQQDAKNNSFIFNRLELALRKILGRDFKPIPYIHDSLAEQQASDIRIEPMTVPKRWHKTFIICGTVKNSG
jgi:2-polyprenyl-3-methyl-5-hydroxy-6-metoxy-1,4-benzoquinol methylase